MYPKQPGTPGKRPGISSDQPRRSKLTDQDLEVVLKALTGASAVDTVTAAHRPETH